MNTEDYLYACVEAGVALSGFAALALAIRSRREAEYAATERLIIATLVERGLAGALFALAPLLLESFEVAERAVWSVCSGAFFVYGISISLRTTRLRRTYTGPELLEARIYHSLGVLAVLVFLAQLLNVLPMGVPQGAHWYLLAVTWLISTAGLYFWVILRSWVRAA